MNIRFKLTFSILTNFLLSGTIILLQLGLSPNIHASDVNHIAPPIDGDLSIELLSGYNFAVDSNDPVSGPRSAHIAVKVCNNGSDDMSDVTIYAGDFAANTPGIFPERTVSEASYGGTFSLENVGDCDETNGERYIGDLAAGECSVQYWLIEYPITDTSGNSVAGANTLADDLWLEFDGWATANDNGTPLAVDDSFKVFMRSMLSASANKAWPNGTAKVPDEYLEIFEDSLGWRPDTSLQFAACAFTIEGIWYDMGNINKGYDSDSNFIHDQNVHLQTIGNPDLFDPCCFRLVKTYGVLIVSLKAGGEELIVFEDQLSHLYIPDNNGAVGLVFYQYVPLSAPCSSIVTPYQTVASGNNNEKYTGDFGITLGGPIAEVPDARLDVTGPVFAALDETIEFEIELCNYAGKELGAVEFNLPLIISDSIPEGTVYQAGSAAANNTYPFGITATIFYSTDYGVTWSETEPPASTVTHIEWRLDQNLPNLACVTPTFETVAPSSTYTLPFVIDEASLRVANGDPFVYAYDTVLIRGIFKIGDSVFLDDGGTTGISGNGVQDGDESGIANIRLDLYYDADGDSTLTTGDVFLLTTTSDVNGYYEFDSLPNTNFLVIVDINDNDLPAGAGITTGSPQRGSMILGANDTTIDFGFMQPIKVDKQLTSGDPAYEGQYISYTIDVYNQIQSESTGAEVFTPSTTHNASYGGDWLLPNNATGLDDGTIATLTNWQKYKGVGWPVEPGHQLLKGFDPFTPCGNIVKVEAVFDFEVTFDMTDDDLGTVLYQNGTYTTNNNIPISLINSDFSPSSDYYYWDITSYITSWSDLDQMEIGMYTESQQGNGWDGMDLEVDAIFAKITVDDPTCTDLSAPFSINSSILTTPLQDDYNPAQLDFQFASVIPDSINETTGELFWDNIGLLDGGQVKRIALTFLGLEPTISGETLLNIASVTNALYANGNPANNDIDTAATTLVGTGSIGDLVWNTNTGLGVPEVSIGLVSSVDLTIDGVFYPAGDTIRTVTDTLGNYLFGGLLDGNYTVFVEVSTIPGTAVQVSDPDFILDNMTSVVISGANDDLTADFGYQVPNAVRGNVLNDVNKDGSPDAPEPGIESVRVNLYNCGGDACGDLNDVLFLFFLTDANGDFEFGNLPDDTYYVVIDTTTLPTPPPGDYWTARFDPDNSMPPDHISQSFSLIGGQFQFGLDFGFSLDGPKTISGTVYEDWNADSIQTIGFEAGIADLIIKLYLDYDNDSTLNYSIDPAVATVTSDSAGNYTFTVLADGNYFVEITNPPAFVPTQDPESDGDHRGMITVTGASITNVDFGYYPVGTADIGDVAWLDVDGDQILDPFEARIPDITIELWSDLDNNGTYTLVSYDTTDTNGNYLFVELPDGNYQVFIDSLDADLPQDLYGENALPTTPTFYEIIISGGVITTINGTACTSCDLTLDFGWAFPGAIGDLVYFDNNNNATQDASELGISGVTVYICDAAVPTCNAGAALASDVTDATGNYLFTGLVPGNYTITIDVATLPSGMTGSDQTADPERDGVPCNDTTYMALPACDNQSIDNELEYGARLLGIDFGYQPPGIIGDLVWLDINGNGIQDSGEPGIGDVSVEIDPPGGVDLGAGVGVPISILTDSEGNYSFGNLPDGNYVITITPPAGYLAVYNIDPTIDNTTTVIINGGVVDGSNSWCSNPAGCDLDIDFGYQLNGAHSIAGSVCMDDVSEDGICSTGGETLLDGITLFLYNDDLLFLGSTTTGALGSFSFTGLPDDDYIVSMSTTAEPFNISRLTTDASDTPASSVNETPSSVYQVVTVTGTISGLDYAYVFDEDIDFGDLPAPYPSAFGDSPTGPYHILEAMPTLYFGTVPDAETNATQNISATGDDLVNIDDEDGITFISPETWVTGVDGGSLSVTVTGSGWLVGYMDFNTDGDFLDSGELMLNQAVTTGTQTLTFDIPATTDLAGGITLYARFRLFESQPPIPSLAYSGSTMNGEVEDYGLQINIARTITPNLFISYKLLKN